jgi:hypothetical protein
MNDSILESHLAADGNGGESGEDCLTRKIGILRAIAFNNLDASDETIWTCILYIAECS